MPRSLISNRAAGSDLPTSDTASRFSGAHPLIGATKTSKKIPPDQPREGDKELRISTVQAQTSAVASCTQYKTRAGGGTLPW